MKKLHHLAPEPIDLDDDDEWTDEDFAKAEKGPFEPPTPERDRADIAERLRAKAKRLRAEANLNERLAERIETLPLKSSYEDESADAPHAAE